MTPDDVAKREQELRRLLSEAVEPVRPKPGSQDRLERRIRSVEHRDRKLPVVLRWSAAGLAAAAIVVVAVLLVGRGGQDSSSSASSAASAPSASASSASASSSAAAEPGSAAAPNGDAAQATRGSSANSSLNPAAAGLGDLDGDGRSDAFTLDGGVLTARLSRAGSQSVSLPAVGGGARVLGVTRLVTAANTPVAVVFVRLSESPGGSRDVVAGLVDDRLALLRFGAGPALLIVDTTHGYSCADGELALSGNRTGYVVQGAQLVASPRLVARYAKAGQASGC